MTITDVVSRHRSAWMNTAEDLEQLLSEAKDRSELDKHVQACKDKTRPQC